MPEWYRMIGEYFGDYQWIMGAVLALMVLLIGVWLVDQIWKRVLIPVTGRTRNNLDRFIATGTRSPVLAVIFSCGAMLIFQWMTSRMGVKVDSGFGVRVLDGAVFVLLTLSCCMLGYALVAAICDWYLKHVANRTSSTLDNEFIPVFRRMSKVVVLFIGMTIVLGHFDVKITALLGAAGFASLAVALAAQETVANMISGFTILVDRPFRVGDRVELGDGTVGDVLEIGLRSTKVLSFDNTLLITPNKEISGARIINHSYPDAKVKIRKDYTVAYGTDPLLVKKILLEICRAHDKVLNEPEPAVFFTDFGDSALVFKLICWVADYKDRFGTTDEINVEIDRRFKEESIEIPFPQQDIHIRSGLDILARRS